jgi:hypothetical protein
MGDTPAADFWDGRGLAMLVGSVLLPPFAWLLDMQVSYSMTKWACENSRRDVLIALPAGSLTLVALAAWMAWYCWIHLRERAHEEGPGVLDRSYLLALAGLTLSALFGLVILTSVVSRVVLSPCE